MATFSAAVLNEHTPAELVEIAHVVDGSSGFDTLFVADERLYKSPYAQLALVARETSSIGIGTGVTNPYTRHPAITAAAVATLDELSGGRALLGLGAGSPMVLDPLGIPQTAPVGTVRTAVDVIRQLHDGATVSADREAFSLSGASLDFTPARRVPIYVAGRGPQLLTLAGHVGDGVIAGAGLASPAGMAYASDHISRGAEIGGRDPEDLDVVCWAFLAMAADRETALEAVAEIVVRIVRAVPLDTLEAIGVPRADAERAKAADTVDELAPAEVRELVSREVAAQFAVVGTPADCRNRVLQLLEAGVDHLGVLPFPHEELGIAATFEAFADDVIAAV